MTEEKLLSPQQIKALDKLSLNLLGAIESLLWAVILICAFFSITCLSGIMGWSPLTYILTSCGAGAVLGYVSGRMG